MDEITSIQTGDGDELSWAEVGRGLLVLLGVLVVAPAGLTILLAVGFVLFPVLLVVVPFILPGTAAEGAAEHGHQREHDSLGLGGDAGVGLARPGHA